MSKELTELKALAQQVLAKATEFELLEEASARGFVPGVKYISAVMKMNSTVTYPLRMDTTGDLWPASGEGRIYDHRNDQWAEIIPEQKGEKLVKLDQVHSKWIGESFNSLLTHLDNVIKGFNLKVDLIDKSEGKGSENYDQVVKRLSEKSLHDQIREGGWPFVCKKAGKQYMTLLISGDVPSLQQEKDCLGQKVSAYTMLLALSKVLNEGKEKGQEIYTVSFRDHDNKLIVTGHLYMDMYPAIEIYNHDDATFALEFAEKEWKGFYNQLERSE